MIKPNDHDRTDGGGDGGWRMRGTEDDSRTEDLKSDIPIRTVDSVSGLRISIFVPQLLFIIGQYPKARIPSTGGTETSVRRLRHSHDVNATLI